MEGKEDIALEDHQGLKNHLAKWTPLRCITLVLALFIGMKVNSKGECFAFDCRCYGKRDFCTRTGLALFVLSGGFIAVLFLFVQLLFTLVFAAVFYVMESETLYSYDVAFYFSVVSFTTVGYGDFTLRCHGSRLVEFFFYSVHGALHCCYCDSTGRLLVGYVQNQENSFRL